MPVIPRLGLTIGGATSYLGDTEFDRSILSSYLMTNPRTSAPHLRKFQRYTELLECPTHHPWTDAKYKVPHPWVAGGNH